jgi:hypothetical protein
MLFIAAVILIGGFMVDFFSSHKAPWAVRKLLPPVCYGAAFGFLVVAIFHWLRK